MPHNPQKNKILSKYEVKKMMEYSTVSEQRIEWFIERLNEVDKDWKPLWNTFTILDSGHTCIILEREKVKP